MPFSSPRLPPCSDAPRLYTTDPPSPPPLIPGTISRALSQRSDRSYAAKDPSWDGLHVCPAACPLRPSRDHHAPRLHRRCLPAADPRGDLPYDPANFAQQAHSQRVAGPGAFCVRLVGGCERSSFGASCSVVPSRAHTASNSSRRFARPKPASPFNLMLSTLRTNTALFGTERCRPSRLCRCARSRHSLLPRQLRSQSMSKACKACIGFAEISRRLRLSPPPRNTCLQT